MVEVITKNRIGIKRCSPGSGKNYAWFINWRKNNPEKYRKSLIKRNEWIEKTKKEFPWWKHYISVVKRCRSEHWYKNHGIKNFLNASDVEFLWNRDRAHEMKEPNIDRIDSSLDYTLSNSRFCEREENQRRMIKAHKPKGWAHKHERCIVCGKTEEKHCGRGLCKCCYAKHRSKLNK